MIDLQELWTLQGELFMLLALGLFFRRLGIVDAGFQKGLTALVIDLVLPCNIICSFQVRMDSGAPQQTGTILVVSLIVQLGCWLLALAAFCRSPKDRRPVLQYAVLCSNAGFLGTPLTEGLFGPEGALLSAVYLIPQRAAMWSLGVSFFTGRGGKSVWKKVLTHPCILAVLMGMVLMMAKISLPAVLDKTVRAVGNCNTALSMFLIGMIMSNLRWRDFLDWEVLYFTGIRLVVIPALVLLGCRVMGIGGLTQAISVLLAAMPAGGTTAIVAARHGGNAEFAATCVTVSTVLSLAAIPLWCLFL